MDDQLEGRVAALERAVTDDEGDPAALADAAVTAERLEELEATVEDLADRVAELEAATQALRGYVGNIRSVNREVEQRADLALSRVEALDDGGSSRPDPSGRGAAAPEPGSESGPHRQREPQSEDRQCASCGRSADAIARQPDRTPDTGAPGTGRELATDGSEAQPGALGTTRLEEHDDDAPAGPIERLRALL
jgi:HAMP domain-containing protein